MHKCTRSSEAIYVRRVPRGLRHEQRIAGGTLRQGCQSSFVFSSILEVSPLDVPSGARCRKYAVYVYVLTVEVSLVLMQLMGVHEPSGASTLENGHMTAPEGRTLGVLSSEWREHLGENVFVIECASANLNKKNFLF